MSTAVDLMLDGMPDPTQLHKIDIGDQVVIMVGSRVVFAYNPADTGMRNIAVVTLTQLKFEGKDVAAVMGLTAVYVSMLRGRARAEGSAGLVRDRGRRAKLTRGQVTQARAWRDEGVSDVVIGKRLQVADTTVARALRGHPAPAGPATHPDTLDLDLEPVSELDSQPEPTPEPEATPQQPEPEPEPEAMPKQPEAEATPQQQEPQTPSDLDLDLGRRPVSGPPPGATPAGWGSVRITQGVFYSRYAGAMLSHAFSDRIDISTVLSGPTKPGQRPLRFDDIALLAATSITFGLGAATIEQVKHLSATEAGPLCGLRHLPDRSTLRPRLAALADQLDPLTLQRAFASAMLTADPCTSGVYYVDDHFVPYTGAKPVPKGWDTKHRTAQRGRADTLITDRAGRAVVFTTAEPSGLTKTLPPALEQLRAVTGPTAKIMLGFDRGGAYPSVFTACIAAHTDWITYRRAPLPATHGLPMTATITTSSGRTRALTYADEPVTIDNYGAARQITLFEHGTTVLQILTSDFTTCPIALLLTLRDRWRIENVFKYAAEHYGIDTLGDYIADIQTNTRPIDNPARKTANTTIKTRKTELAHAEQHLAQLMADRTLTVTALNQKLLTAQAQIEKMRKAVAATEATRNKIPAKLPANIIDPDAKRALLRTNRRGLQMVLRLLAYNSEHWLSARLNTYLRDPEEYRAITRETILRGLTGTITYTPTTITVQLNPPDSPKISRALALLLQEINTIPPRLPADPRPITYTLTQP